jgi:hypothetical protein
MSWQTLSLHFKQQYDGAFRYLDRCGEFMLAAVDQMNFIPDDPKPTGAKLEIPERGLTAGVNTLDLVAAQEIPGNDDQFFLNTCVGLAALVSVHFQPKRIIRNGFACKSYWPIPNADTLLATSLQFGGNAHADLGKQLGMVPAHKRLDFNFTSGSMDLHVLLHPVTFEKVSVNRHNPNFKASSVQKERVERLNKFADRFSVHLSHALLLEIDLMEVDPPQRSLEQHFNELKRHTDMLRKQFIVQ